ncbi:ammonium transporter [Iamia sp. SCSIO 61187]|uniref:ammonium transporter n=1 Tax=Iamia sp. SCSIO 61187 TaxID=2722752 RepID=UPI001C62D535|nr:ammonium transporter [Iamia sp. SCSIO 61187]QYG91189.1 ammonium transporter [Iamia sp. SCSIO 61187]
MEGNLAWVLISAALVLFMTPGLAFFYGGMDRSRNVLNMLMMNFWCLLIIPVVWVVVGFSLAYGTTGAANDFIGNFDNLFLRAIDISGEDGGLVLATVLFLGMFAVITPALISGAVADRMKFSAWAIFAPVWMLLVFVPVFKWVYGGWFGQGVISDDNLFLPGSIDFAGGTAIHVNAGIAALACVWVLGKRRGWPGEGHPPHSMPLVMLGTGILWFGWFGFNAGSALAANGQAVQAFANTFVAAAAAGLAWCLVERARDGHFTNLGAASGIVAGLVAITPCAGFVSGMAPLWIGLIAGVVCCFAVGLKTKLGYDDALDVVGVHFVGGLTGSLLLGLFADPDYFASAYGDLLEGYDGPFMEGLLLGGGPDLLIEQVIANGATIVYSFVVTALIMMALKATIGVRVSEEVEDAGLDLAEHSETAYHDSPGYQVSDALESSHGSRAPSATV